MRYTFFVGNLRAGGAERVISILANKMAEHGHDVEIILYYDDELFYELNSLVKVTVVQKQTGTKNKISNTIWLHRYIKRNADILISFLASFNILAILASKGTSVPVIAADRNDPRRVPSNFVIRKTRDFLYRFAGGVVVQTEYNKRYFSKAVRSKSKVIYNPVHLGEKAGAALNVRKEKKIVNIGRLLPQKNQMMLLEVFKEIHKRYMDHSLVIYGEGAERSNLERYVKQNGLENCVALSGTVTDVFDEIVNAEMFVLSSDYEGMPNALIEAMCLGVPVISTKVSGAAELIKNGKNGLLVDTGDKEALLNAIEKYIKEPRLAWEYSRRAVSLNEKLCLDKIYSQWIEYFENITGQGR